MNKLTLVALLALLGTSACAVRVARPHPGDDRLPPPPPGRVARAMDYDEAVHRAIEYAHSRGFEGRVKTAHRTGNGIWKVKLAVSRPDARGRLHLELDAWTREIIRAQEHVKYREDRRRRDRRHHQASAVNR